jgi:methylenetetrahydrofolate dehydrogenase (NADP+)/methenyltetrahydrofolate cyclohydrolase
MIILKGIELSQQREKVLSQKISSLNLEKKIVIASIIFKEDKGSCLYTRLKKETAERIGIIYQTYYFSLLDSFAEVVEQIKKLNSDDLVTGIILQKPSKKCFLQICPNQFFKNWWDKLVSCLSLKKDVDGLHPETLLAIKNNEIIEKKLVLPATCRAVLIALAEFELELKTKIKDKKFLILGKTDLLGKPLFYFLWSKKIEVEMIGSKEMYEKIDNNQKLFDYDVVISATGRKNLIKPKWLKKGVAVIDVGEPKGDVDVSEIEKKASFLTPVPGGIGPLTVISLLENGFELFIKNQN